MYKIGYITNWNFNLGITKPTYIVVEDKDLEYKIKKLQEYKWRYTVEKI